jgi:hypothetical protein
MRTLIPFIESRSNPKSLLSFACLCDIIHCVELIGDQSSALIQIYAGVVVPDVLILS